MSNPNCKSSCSFTRKVKDSMGGGNWSVSTAGDPGVTVSPQQFTLTNGGTQNLTISADTSTGNSIGRWSYTTIVLKNTNGNAPDAHLSLAVYGSPGDLPTNININSSHSSGSKLVNLSGLVAITDGSYEAAGMVKPTVVSSVVAEDPTPDSVGRHGGMPLSRMAKTRSSHGPGSGTVSTRSTVRFGRISLSRGAGSPITLQRATPRGEIL